MRAKGEPSLSMRKCGVYVTDYTHVSVCSVLRQRCHVWIS
jgi:hypothetical protein